MFLGNENKNKKSHCLWKFFCLLKPSRLRGRQLDLVFKSTFQHLTNFKKAFRFDNVIVYFIKVPYLFSDLGLLSGPFSVQVWSPGSRSLFGSVLWDWSFAQRRSRGSFIEVRSNTVPTESTNRCHEHKRLCVSSVIQTDKVNLGCPDLYNSLGDPTRCLDTGRMSFVLVDWLLMELFSESETSGTTKVILTPVSSFPWNKSSVVLLSTSLVVPTVAGWEGLDTQKERSSCFLVLLVFHYTLRWRPRFTLRTK